MEFRRGIWPPSGGGAQANSGGLIKAVPIIKMVHDHFIQCSNSSVYTAEIPISDFIVFENLIKLNEKLQLNCVSQPLVCGGYSTLKLLASTNKGNKEEK